MDTESLARAPRTRTSRHHRCDHAFLKLLEEDYGIDQYSLRSAFMGVPAAPKKEAIALCEWAVRAGGGDPEKTSKALRAWAKKHARGTYGLRLVAAPALTWEQTEHERRVAGMPG